MAMTQPTADGTAARGQRKTKVGRVVSDKMDKTIVVSVERLTRHRLYKRVIRLSTKFKAHDEANEAHVGDTVLIEESRPLSATKRWRLVEVVQRADDHGRHRRRDHRERQAGDPERRREEGRRGPRGHRADGQGIRPPRWQLHPI